MSVFQSVLIWFGAGISIAEILTGSYFAPLGLAKGSAAILIGHLIGCALFFATGLVGARSKRNAMQATALSFGNGGAKFFALLNVMQLVGWTGIMIYDGSLSAAAIFAENGSPGRSSQFGPFNLFNPLGQNALLAQKVSALVIGALIVLWILIGISNLGRLNVFAMASLFVLTVILSVKIFSSQENLFVSSEILSFGTAVELAAAMPLSWLPVISDYTKDAKKPVAATLGSTVTYFFISSWMYFIGMGAELFSGSGDITRVMLKAGLGIPALVIVVLSTVTTTFLDAYSAGLSLKTIFEKINVRAAGIVAAAIGTAAALLFNMDNITDFLYLIGSVFAPMTAVLLADFFVLKKDSSRIRFNWTRLLVWLFGFAFYRFLMRFDFACGYTLPDMAATFLLTLCAESLDTRVHTRS